MTHLFEGVKDSNSSFDYDETTKKSVHQRVIVKVIYAERNRRCTELTENSLKQIHFVSVPDGAIGVAKYRFLALSLSKKLLKRGILAMPTLIDIRWNFYLQRDYHIFINVTNEWVEV